MATRKRTNPCDGFQGRCAKQISYQIELMNHIFAREKWLPSQDFRKYASNTPNIDGRSVLQVKKNIQINSMKMKVYVG
jgi:hypothetical protein